MKSLSESDSESIEIIMPGGCLKAELMGDKVKLICSIGKVFEGEYIKGGLNKMSQINTDYVNFSNPISRY